MKKIIILILLFITSFAFAQQWQEVDYLYEYLDLFDLEVKVWYNSQTGVLNFEDIVSEEPQDVIYQLTFSLAAIQFYMEDEDVDYKNLGFDHIFYSYFVIFNPDENRYHDDQLRWDIDFDKKWLETYFNARSREQEQMILLEFDKAYEKFRIKLDNELEEQR